MAVTTEQVVVDILARDYASNVLSTIKRNLESLSSVKLPNMGNINVGAVINQVSGVSSQINQSSAQISGLGASANATINSVSGNFTRMGSVVSQSTAQNVSLTNNFGKTLSETGKSGDKAGENINKRFNVSKSVFSDLSGIMLNMSSQFTNIANSIAGMFGAVGLSGMVEKMWRGASERQNNMLYLIHQKGVDEANKYYDEIMSIVTRLPGDDTFLTNILNMASALDENIKLDNLKEMGTAITDYYIAATMKGENSFEVQKDLRKYITQGDTRMMRNSVLASEIDSLKNKNSVLERTVALQKALDKLGFSGMSEYESATNALEEFKGHFQKAFADLGTLLISVVQPLLKFYNIMDTIFGSRLSQVIIIVGIILIGFFTVLSVGVLAFSLVTRSIKMASDTLLIFGNIAKYTKNTKSLLNAVIWETIGAENAETIAINGSVIAGLRKIATEVRETAVKSAKRLVTIINIALGRIEIAVTGEQIGATATLTGVTISEADAQEYSLLVRIQSNRQRIVSIVNTIREAFSKWLHGESSIGEAIGVTLETLSEQSNILAKVISFGQNVKNIAQDIISIGVKIAKATITWITTGATFAEAFALEFDAFAKMNDAGATGLLDVATLGLAGSLETLWAALGPVGWIIIAISVAIIGLIAIFGVFGDSLNIFDGIGDIFGAISDGIGRIWNAFTHSDIVQGIIQYFRDFIDTIKEVIERIGGFFATILGFGNSGEFDVVQLIIDIFHKVGEVIKWVWNLMDDWSNSPLGIISWLNPLGILLFHLDEIGSFFEDVRDAIDRFVQTPEFQELSEAFGEIFTELQEPLQEIWDIIGEIVGLIGEIFSSEDPEGQGTEQNINFLVEILKGLAYILKTVVIPTIKAFVTVIVYILGPIKAVLGVVRDVLSWINGAKDGVDIFGKAWELLTLPLNTVQKSFDMIGKSINRFIGYVKNLSSPFKPFLSFINRVIQSIQWLIQQLNIFGDVWLMISQPIKMVQDMLGAIGNTIKSVTDAIKNSIIGKLLGWDKEDNKNNEEDTSKKVKNNLYGQMKNQVKSSDMNFITKQQILGELDKQNNSVNSNNANDVRNLGKTYNNTNNQRQVVINQNFAQGSMPIDARNMTKKEARKMFIGAFGYRRAVGHKGILK